MTLARVMSRLDFVQAKRYAREAAMWPAKRKDWLELARRSLYGALYWRGLEQAQRRKEAA